MEEKSIYHRKKPIREFDLNQTLYNTILNSNQDNMNLDAISFLGTKMSYKDLINNVDRLADAYTKIGIKEGDTVAICTINMPIVQENLLALSKIGATSRWIDLRVKGKDLINNINDSGCKILVVFEGITPMIEEIVNETDVTKILVASPKDYLNPIIRVLADMKDKKEGKQIVLPNDNRFLKYQDFLKTGKRNSNLKPASFEKDRPSLIVQSSGSTGKPKSIVHTEYNFNSSMQKEAYTDLPLYAGNSMHIAIPPFIIYGLNNSIYASLAFGLNAQMTPFISETTVYDDLGKYNISCAAPLHYRYLYGKIIELKNKIEELERCNSPSEKKELKSCLKELSKIMKKISNVNVFVSGGDKITANELLDMERLFEKTIVNGYGNNEMAGAAIITPVYASKPDSVGVPMKGITVSTFDPDTLEELEIGIEGEICVKSDNIFVEYLNNVEETKNIKRKHSDGTEWIHTGDLGLIDSDGYVYINGRSKRLIKREAFKISPDTIENVIMNIPEVEDCVVVGVSDIDKDGSYVPMAYVEVKPEYKENFALIQQKIEQMCMSELPDYEFPAYIMQIEKIPYQNNKHAFKILEEKGENFVSSLKKQKIK